MTGGHVRQLDGVVEVLDGQGNARLRLEPPFVVDARGERHEAGVSLDGSRLNVSLPASLHHYPALLDPGWVTTGKMVSVHYSHTLTTLSNGKVMACGGRGPNGFTHDKCELYDPPTGTWTATGSMTTVRKYQAAVLLKDCQVTKRLCAAEGREILTQFWGGRV